MKIIKIKIWLDRGLVGLTINGVPDYVQIQQTKMRQKNSSFVRNQKQSYSIKKYLYFLKFFRAIELTSL